MLTLAPTSSPSLFEPLPEELIEKLLLAAFYHEHDLEWALSLRGVCQQWLKIISGRAFWKRLNKFYFPRIKKDSDTHPKQLFFKELNVFISTFKKTNQTDLPIPLLLKRISGDLSNSGIPDTKFTKDAKKELYVLSLANGRVQAIPILSVRNQTRALITATEFGYHSSVKKIIANIKPIRELFPTALIAAARLGYLHIFKLLARKKRLLNIDNFKAALFAAAENGHDPILERIFSHHDADEILKNNFAEEAFVIAYRNNKPAIAKMIATKTHIQNETKEKAIEHAVKKGYMDIVTWLLPEFRPITEHLLLRAAEYDQAEIQAFILDILNAEILVTVRQGDWIQTKALLKIFKNNSSLTSLLPTLIIEAIHYGHCDVMVELAVELWSPFVDQTLNWSLGDALIAAASLGFEDIVDELLNQTKISEHTFLIFFPKRFPITHAKMVEAHKVANQAGFPQIANTLSKKLEQEALAGSPTFLNQYGKQRPDEAVFDMKHIADQFKKLSL